MRVLSSSRSRLAIASLVAGVVLVAGCGGGGGGGSSATVVVTAPTGGGTPSVTIEAHDIYFVPKSIKAPTGKLKIVLVNHGSQQHTLAIDGISTKTFELKVGPGKTDTGTLDFKPGVYTYYCTVPGHRAQGMQGTLTIGS